MGDGWARSAFLMRLQAAGLRRSAAAERQHRDGASFRSGDTAPQPNGDSRRFSTGSSPSPREKISDRAWRILLADALQSM